MTVTMCNVYVYVCVLSPFTLHLDVVHNGAILIFFVSVLSESKVVYRTFASFE